MAPNTEQSTEESFDWWSAPAPAREKQEQRQEHGSAADPYAEPAADPYAEPAADRAAEPVDDAAAAIYRAVHESPEFREIRTRYRRFVFPATAAFLLWYLLYVVLAVSAPQLMARPIAGPFNTAWLLGLLQFASTFLLTWLYARHARAHRDRAALGLRWETQDRLR
ncbi:DUF485 domain-containing protein [Streptacidiphilus pinicola]|uniref:DUF485 domain-containing protein n=1 Tax=Streptacidiphilus pinicola TaxID=2219663 RepID=A0A2X0ICB8_9ACTN|nr:DUF485 domain-containing protein [Streptacidiphilus pinicola]